MFSNEANNCWRIDYLLKYIVCKLYICAFICAHIVYDCTHLVYNCAHFVHKCVHMYKCLCTKIMLTLHSIMLCFNVINKKNVF